MKRGFCSRLLLSGFLLSFLIPVSSGRADNLPGAPVIQGGIKRDKDGKIILTAPDASGGVTVPALSGGGAAAPAIRPVIAADGPDDIVGLRIENPGMATSDAGPVTFGQVFAPGEVPSGTGIVAIAAGQPLPVQLDVKATHQDKSARHAIVTFSPPNIPPGDSVDVMLRRGQAPQSGKPVSVEDLLKGEYDLQVEMRFRNPDGSGKTFRADGRALLKDAIARGRVATWFQGPQASEFTITAPINRLMDLRINLRAFADGDILADVIFAADKAFTKGNDNLTYDVTITHSGQEVFRRENLEHHHKATWHRSFWMGADHGLAVIRDMEHFMASGATPLYDLSVGISGSSLSDSVNRMIERGHGPMAPANVEQTMGKGGGREDIGPLPAWTVRHMIAQSRRTAQVMYANADAAGAVPWHYRDNKTGKAVTLDNHPIMWMDERDGNKVFPDAFSPQDTGWEPDIAHRPSLTYLPYLLTGSQYYREELQAEVAFAIASIYQGWRGSNGEIAVGGEQTRAQAWVMRDISDAAYILPDADPLKKYFVSQLRHNLKMYVEKYVEPTPPFQQAYGMIEGYGTTSNKPWMDDYFTMVLATIARRGNKDAQRLLEWKANYTIGRFLAEDFGLPAMAGIGYLLNSHKVVKQQKVYYTTWQEMMDATYSSQGKKVRTTPQYQGSVDGMSALAKAALAGLAQQGHPGAVEAYAFVVTRNPEMTPNYSNDPGFALALKTGPTGGIIRKSAERLGTLRGDDMTGTGGNDLLHGLDGDDRINGGDGIDALLGGNGVDNLIGGPGDDLLFGQKGDDVLQAGPGNDRLKGGKGRDRLTGGKGRDVFIIARLSEAGDLVTDYQPGVDQMDLRAVIKAAGRGAEIATRQGEAGAEVRLLTKGRDILLLTLQHVKASGLTHLDFAR